MKLKYLDITLDNIIMATEFEMTFFKSCAFTSYLDGIKNNMPYMLVYDNDVLIGMTGLYKYDELGEPNTAWLGWFGVRKDIRQKGYGRQIIEDMCKMAKDKLGCNTLRLYTSAIQCPEAMFFYNKVMDFGEPYTLEEKELERWVYTKSLTDKPATKWNNRSLKLSHEKEREGKGLKKYLQYKESVKK